MSLKNLKIHNKKKYLWINSIFEESQMTQLKLLNSMKKQKKRSMKMNLKIK